MSCPVEYFRLRDEHELALAALREVQELGVELAGQDFRGPEPFSRQLGRQLVEVAERGLGGSS